ncbi:MAG: hypothetical protein PHS73_03330 [Candidatus Peribacteraceae bacterium]|nr:hypothetical protein [Candidatus Peribacteraceae bacterium]
MNTNTDTTGPLLQWSAPEKPLHQRGKRWYIAAGCVIAALLAYAALTQAWTFLAVIIIGAIVYGLVHGKPHPTHTILITEKGLEWDKRLIPWEDCTGFWMLQGKDYVELHIALKKGRNRHLTVQTGTLDPLQMHALLAQYMPFLADRRENILDAIFRICKL